jgi:hypothetical protein
MGIKIEFVSTMQGLEDIEECRPKPAKNFIPEWFKNIPSDDVFSVKKCPSFPDFFSQGFVLPMWMDSELYFDERVGPKSDSSEIFQRWGTHANQQLIDYVSPYFNGQKAQFVFKTECPWRIITPPGWSVYQMPLFYHFNQEWSVLPGIVDTDIHHIINQQVLYHGNETKVRINRGDPFVLYIPFKREKHKYDVRSYTDKDLKRFRRQEILLKTKLFSSGSYRLMQRERDKNER